MVLRQLVNHDAPRRELLRDAGTEVRCWPASSRRWRPRRSRERQGRLRDAQSAARRKILGILPDADPAPFSFRRPNGFKATIKKVTDTGVVKGTLQP